MRVVYPGLFLTWLVGQLMQLPQNFGVQLDLPVFTGGSTGLERSVAEDLSVLFKTSLIWHSWLLRVFFVRHKQHFTPSLIWHSWLSTTSLVWYSVPALQADKSIDLDAYSQ